MKTFILFVALLGFILSQNITYIGFKDFWPERLDMGTNQAGRGEELERARDVGQRATLFFTQYPLAEIISVSYVLYAQLSLRNRDQNFENAPLAVNRNRDNDNEDLDTITNKEVWRYTFKTTDLDTYLAIVPDREETVESSASGIAVSGTIFIFFIFLCFMDDFFVACFFSILMAIIVNYF